MNAVAQDSGNNYFMSIQSGVQNTGLSTNDDYLEKLAEDHGNVNEDRIANPLVVTLEFYRGYGSVGAGFTLESHRYAKKYSFPDESSVHVAASGVIYSFNFHYLGDIFMPFLGFGSGTYTADISERLMPSTSSESRTRARVRASNPTSLLGKIGMRIPLGYCGFILTWYTISAPVTVPTEKRSFELGGDANLLGVYCGF